MSVVRALEDVRQKARRSCRPRLVRVLGLATLAVGAFALWLTTADLKPLLERKASDDLQRSVTIGAVKVNWGDPLAIEFTDLHRASARC